MTREIRDQRSVLRYLIFFIALGGLILVARQPTQAQASLAASEPVVLTLHPAAGVVDPLALQSPFLILQPITYSVQSGDTLPAVAARFRVRPQDITSPGPLSMTGLLAPGQALLIARPPADYPPAQLLLPDSEVIFSPSVTDFDVVGYVSNTYGYFKTHQEYLRSTGMTSGAEIVARIARENSINPRLLLSLLEYQCGCVLRYPAAGVDRDYLLGVKDPLRKGLYRQLGWAINQLSLGYYGWREGLISEFYFPDGTIHRTSPHLNAGSVALQALFARLYDSSRFQQAADPQTGFVALHHRMFGDPWQRARAVEPLLPAGLAQPPLSLPFVPGEVWSYTSGPHKAWETEAALAALDFAPPSRAGGCLPSSAWVTASAAGLVVRSEHGAVVQDLDNDGLEQTGWAILYMHIADQERVAPGVSLRAGDPIGHPSCEGGPANGTHLHIARKYNGEWIAADGPLPFVMGGWTAHAGFRPYEGTLIREGAMVIANPYAARETFIVSEPGDAAKKPEQRLDHSRRTRDWRRVLKIMEGLETSE